MGAMASGHHLPGGQRPEQARSRSQGWAPARPAGQGSQRAEALTRGSPGGAPGPTPAGPTSTGKEPLREGRAAAAAAGAELEAELEAAAWARSCG